MLNLLAGESKRFYIALRDARGLLVPTGEGERITLECSDPRVDFDIDSPVRQDPEASAMQIALSGVVELSSQPLPALPKVEENPAPRNDKPFHEWTPEEKDEHHRRARSADDAKFPNRFPSRESAPIVVTAIFKGKNGVSTITDTIIPSGRTSGKLFGGQTVLTIPEAPRHGASLDAIEKDPTFVLGNQVAVKKSPTYVLGNSRR